MVRLDYSGDAQLSGRFILRARYPLVKECGSGMVMWNPEHLALEPSPFA